MNSQPPDWARALLGLVVSHGDLARMSGELDGAYEDRIRTDGRASADAWYARRVLGYAWRATWVWAAMLSAAFLARTAYDWLVPASDFQTRSAVTTYVGVSMLLTAAFWGAWRSKSVLAGVALAVLASQVAAVFSAAGVGVLLAIWHDPVTLGAIDGSGGLWEAFTLPFFLIVPAIVMGALGSALGAVTRRVFC